MRKIVLTCFVAVSLLCSLGYIAVVLTHQSVPQPGGGALPQPDTIAEFTNHLPPDFAVPDGGRLLVDLASNGLPKGMYDVPLFEVSEILQSYEVVLPSGERQFVVSFHTTGAAADAMVFYRDWLVARGWPALLQPAASPTGVYAVKGGASLSVAVVSEEPTRLSIMYVQR